MPQSISTSPPSRGRNQSGPANPNWRGGRVVDPRGYVLLRIPEHPRADCRGYVYEHVVIAEQMLGRSILPTEHVHHRDRDTSNNAPENLEVLSGRRHISQHHKKRSDLRDLDEPNPDIACACGCGSVFPKYDASGRPRRYVSGHNTAGRK